MTKHLCSRCGQPITEGQQWEYTEGAPRFSEEAITRRIHSTCVAQLIRETLQALARVSEADREHITFEI